MTDPAVCNLLKEHYIRTRGTVGPRLEFFNPFQSGARALLDEFPAFSDQRQDSPIVLVVGAGRMGQEVICRLAWQWSTRNARPTLETRPSSDSIRDNSAPAARSEGPGLTVILVDREARRKSEAIRNLFPGIVQACKLIECEMDVRWPEFERFDWLCCGGRLPESVYVCLDDNSLALQAGLKLQAALKDCWPTIVVRMSDDTGFTALLKAVGSSASPAGRPVFNLQAFSLMNKFWHPGCSRPKPSISWLGLCMLRTCDTNERMARHCPMRPPNIRALQRTRLSSHGTPSMKGPRSRNVVMPRISGENWLR